MRTHLALLVLATTACVAPLTLSRDDSAVVLTRHAIQAPDPGERGPYAVKRLYYGSGTDRRRREYRDSVTMKTASVDASPFVSFEKKLARSRRRYWGFEPKAFPVNGRVWYPDGAGPFPLVVVVHGNHDMKDYSDPGYGYLGELLASRGYVVASVDENFLNGPARNENDARAWMLLQHVKAFHGFARGAGAFAGNPLAGRVDTTRIALVGHSRGGEAVAHAAAFNRMRYYPDDATVRLGFDYAIRAIVAIAPVDGQYRPADRLMPLKDVSYLVFHGSHDGDVSTFHGLRQWQRVTLADTSGRAPLVKSAVYVYRANHGQWNTVWGSRDRGPRSGRSLQLRALMPAADQRRFAEVWLSAFLETTLRERRDYLPMFRDHRVAGGWLPRTMYITRYEEAGLRPVAAFDEDVDVTTGTLGGVVLEGDSLSTWKEGVVPFRWRDERQDNAAVWLGWSNRVAGADSTVRARPATYTLRLPDTLATAWRLERGAALSLLLAPTSDTPGPRKAKRDSTHKDSAASARPERKGTTTRDAPEEPIDLTVELEDAGGATAALPLSRYGAPRRPLDASILRRRGRDEARFASTSELVLQTYVLPLAHFAAANPRLDLARLRAVRLRFDRTTAGTVVLDDLGFFHPLPAPPTDAAAA
ncbi:MAG TPA: hypothetical protein VFY16_08490, partial [Gemmatimonadaceae bacterium]|nr:hypothetical protein [Gemmatimonadaceae bacterium]